MPATPASWVSNATDDNLAKWDEASTPGGYGQVAIELDSVVGGYSGIGARDGFLQIGDTATVQGPATVVIRAFAKATAETMTLRSCVLSAKASPQR